MGIMLAHGFLDHAGDHGDSLFGENLSPERTLSEIAAQHNAERTENDCHNEGGHKGLRDRDSTEDRNGEIYFGAIDRHIEIIRPSV